MSSIVPRPADLITEDHLWLGMPFVDFALLLSGGTYGPYRNLGIVENAEFEKALDFAQLRSAQSGTDVLIRELVRSLDATLNVGVFNFDENNIQLFFASQLLTAVNASTPSVADDPFTLTDDNQDFLDLANPTVVEAITAVTCGQITDEAVGTATAAADGDTLGDFTLDFKPLAFGDVTEISVTTPAGVTTVYDAPAGPGAGDIIALAAPPVAGLEVEVEDFGDDTTEAGRLRFNDGGVATGLAVGTSVIATYKPSHSFTENTDYVVDYLQGRVRMLPAKFNPATEPNALELKSFQPMEADYDHTVIEHFEHQPFTQFVFPGRARIRLLTEVGSNLWWPIPKAQVRLTDEALAFSRDNFAIGSLAIQLLDNGGTAPYGTLKTYKEQA